jgi:hypothetical protein
MMPKAMHNYEHRPTAKRGKQGNPLEYCQAVMHVSLGSTRRTRILVSGSAYSAVRGDLPGLQKTHGLQEERTIALVDIVTFHCEQCGKKVS